VRAHLKKIIKKWFAVSRLAYNAALDELKANPATKKFTLRNSIKEKLNETIKEHSVPMTVVEYAVFEARLAFKQSQDAVYRTERQLSAAISIDGRNIREGLIYGKNLKQQLVKMISDKGISKRAHGILVNEALEQCRVCVDIISDKVCKIIHKKQSDKFYLSVPVEIDKQQNLSDEIVAVDPGVSPFATVYSSKYHGYIGEDWYKKASKLLKTGDKLLTDAKTEKRYFRRCKLKKAAARVRKKVTNIVKDMHWKTANFLARNHKIILMPEMQISKMVSRANLPANVSRAIMCSSQFLFRQRLIQKANENNSAVILCKEYYTSKTCTMCGNIKEDLGSNKTYNCLNCNVSTHRDYNGARNIMLKHLSMSDGSFTSNGNAVE
jgi:putative transposase